MSRRTCWHGRDRRSCWLCTFYGYDEDGAPIGIDGGDYWDAVRLCRERERRRGRGLPVVAPSRGREVQPVGDTPPAPEAPSFL